MAAERVESEDAVATEVTPEEPYTTFTPWKKRYIIFLAAFAGMFSPMSSFVFYPAITAISQSLGVSIGLVNLAISTLANVALMSPSFSMCVGLITDPPFVALSQLLTWSSRAWSRL